MRRDGRSRSSRAARRIHANVVASQVALHAPTGGIVPEVAARAHLRWIVPVLDEALRGRRARRSADVDAVAVTERPGPRRLAAGRHQLRQDARLGARQAARRRSTTSRATSTRPGCSIPARTSATRRRSRSSALVVSRRPHVPRRDARPPHVPAARPDRRRRRGRGVRQGRAGCSAWATRAGPAISAAADARDRARPALPAGVAGRLVRLPLLGPQDRRAADRRARRAPTPACRPTTATAPLPDDVVAELAWGFQDSVVDVLATKTLRAAEATGPAGSCSAAAWRRTRRCGQRIAAGAAARGHPARRPAARPVHRQRRDDRRGRRAAARRGRRRDARARRSTPTWPLAKLSRG